MRPLAKHRRCLFALSWVVAVAAITAGAGRAGELSFDTIFDEGASGLSAKQPAWAPDGKRLAYRWAVDGEEGLWLLDVENGDERRLLTASEAGERGLESLAAPQWSPTGDSILMVSGGDLFLVGVAEGAVRRLTKTDEAETDPKFSPSGDRLAFVRDFDLFTIDLESGEERALTTGGSENEILNATTDWVYWEEIWGRNATGYWWSPEGDRIAYYQFDDRHVKSYPLVDFTLRYPEVKWQKYPKAGEENPIVRVGVLDLASGDTTWLETGEMDGSSDVYLARVDWRPSGDRVAVQRLNRDQNRLDLMLCDPSTAGCSTILTETSETWVNVTSDLRFLPDNRFLWTSEESGWKRLGLFSASGELVEVLTPDENWAVDSVQELVGGDEAVVYSAFLTSRLGAAERSVFYHVLSGQRRSLGPNEAWNRALAAPATGNVVLTTSSADRPPETLVLDLRGTEIASLPATPPPFLPEALPEWEFSTIPGPEGRSLPTAMLKPADFNGTSKYPAIMYHYGGPASQVVANRWAGSRNLWHKLMAERGFVVLMVDNAGSVFFGKEGADLLHRRFGEYNLAAQRSGVAFLERLEFVDTLRIGLWGWSGGGANTLYSLLNSPGTWKAGVAGAPVTDWRFYDTIWTERYLDHPEDNPEGYRDSSPITHASNLGDELLIVHGTADDNVHPQNTIAMTRRLIDAGLPFEEAIHPRQKHGFRGADSRHFYERMTEFFDRHLGRRVKPDPLVTELSVPGGIKAGSFQGDGAWIVNLDPENLAPGTAPINVSGAAASAMDLKCDGCVSEFELSFDPLLSEEAAIDLECADCVSETELDFETVGPADLGTGELEGLDCQGGGRYEDNADGTVTDCRTGLVWLRDASCEELAVARGREDATWLEALKVASKLATGSCGLTDGSAPGFWRLPTITEWMATLASARRQGFYEPSLTNTRGSGRWTEGDPFVGVLASPYWSSTEEDVELAWNIHLGQGGISFGQKLYRRFVWPVRASK